MIHHPIFVYNRLNAFFVAARSAACLSRLLLLVIAVEVITMPFTQGIWSWDKFLHGGQDFELGLLLIVTCLCLVLLRVQQNENSFGWIAAMQALLLKARSRSGPKLAMRPASFEHRSRIPFQFCAAALNPPLLI